MATRLTPGGVHSRRVEIGSGQRVLVPQKGRWKRVEIDGKETAKVSCPNCGRVGHLAEHAIAESGEVTPALVCACGWTDTVELAGWRTPLAVPAPGPAQEATPAAAQAATGLGAMGRA
jgi:ribosomal protein S27AE